jgi:hypothetical protein
MELRGYIATIGATFDRAAPMSSPAQVLLRQAPDELKEMAPVGYRVTGSGGAGNPATIPWFGFLDPEETTTPLEGLYVVYLFNAPLDAVVLTLIQGITLLHDRVNPPAAARASRRARDRGRVARRGWLGRVYWGILGRSHLITQTTPATAARGPLRCA